MRTPNKFIDPASGVTYEWLVNHHTEDAFGQTRNIAHTGPTGVASDPLGTGLIRQEGDPNPFTMKLQGTILHASQFNEFWGWYKLSTAHSIYYEEFTGAKYEVIITNFQPVKQRTLRNPRDPSIPLHYWNYDLEMEVLSFLAGVEHDWVLKP